MARFVLDKVAPDLAAGDVGVALHWAGGVWLALAAATGGARLVRANLWWLRLIAAVGALALAAIAWSLADENLPDLTAEAGIGAVAVVLSAVLFLRTPGSTHRGTGHGTAG